MKVGILGSGDVGRSLGTGFSTAGHEVKLGTRHPEQPEIIDWVAKTRPNGSVGSLAESASFGEVLVVATRGVNASDAVRSAGISHFSGKVVIDVTNPLDAGPNGVPRLARLSSPSNGETLQALLPSARVVKAFNIVNHRYMFRPTFPGGPPDMFIAGNDDAAKTTVGKILGEFGWPSVIDIGPIEGARELESLCILWVKSALKLGNFDIAFKLLGK